MSATLESKPKLPGFISLLLVIALGISLAKLMWLIITPQQQIMPQNQTNNIATENKINAPNYGKLIADQHIFGEVVVKKDPVTPKATPIAVVKPVVPKVKLNAKLFGIVAYKSQKSFALISTNNGPQKVYGKGDTLQEGVTINNIFPTKVVIDNNGTNEELLLPVKGKNKNAGARQQSSRQSNAALAKTNPSLPNASLPTATTQDNELPDLNQFRQEILSDPSKLMDIVRASPAVVNGKFVGFRVRSGKNRKLFRQLNFRANDIITEVNGIVLDDQNKGIEVLAQLESATDLSIKVQRGNQEVFIDHSF